jgi:hypothetical protein
MPLGAIGAAGLVSLLGRTWRIDTRGITEYDRRIANGERCIFAFWHSCLLTLTYTHRRRAIAVLVSRHRDGEWITLVLHRFGYRTARGSSTRGGEEGVRELLALAERRALLAITPDGPRGPAERAKPGLIYLASRTGFPVVPAAAAASDAWVLRSWDRFRVPRPFARVVVAYGEPIHVPRNLDDAAAEMWRVRIEEAITRLARETSAAAGARA